MNKKEKLLDANGNELYIGASVRCVDKSRTTLYNSKGIICDRMYNEHDGKQIGWLMEMERKKDNKLIKTSWHGYRVELCNTNDAKYSL